MNTSAFVKIQVAVALLAIAATVVASKELLPLTEQLVQLKSDVAQLEAKKAELQRTNRTLSANATPVDASAPAAVGWLYVGRVNGEKMWAPPAEGVAPTPDPKAVEGFKSVTVSKNTPYVDSVASAKVDVTDFKPSDSQGPTRLVSAGTTLDVMEVKHEPSAGGAQLLWVKVSIPAKSILELQGKRS